MVACARQVVVLADSSKIGVESPIRFADARRGRRAGHRRRRSTAADRRAPDRAPASRSWSHDRHPDRQPEPSTAPSPSPARSSAARCIRAASMTSQAGGKGVNISRAAVVGRPPVDRRAPGPEGRPVRPRAARRRHRLPPGHAPPATSGSTSRSPSPTAPPRSSTAPAPTVTPDVLADLDGLAAPPRRQRPTGWCWPARCRPGPRRLVRRPGRRPARDRRPDRRRHQRGSAAGPRRRGSRRRAHRT